MHYTTISQIIDPAKEDSHYWGEVEENLRAINIWIGEECRLEKIYRAAMIRITQKIILDNPR